MLGINTNLKSFGQMLSTLPTWINRVSMGVSSGIGLRFERPPTQTPFIGSDNSNHRVLNRDIRKCAQMFRWLPFLSVYNPPRRWPSVISYLITIFSQIDNLPILHLCSLRCSVRRSELWAVLCLLAKLSLNISFLYHFTAALLS